MYTNKNILMISFDLKAPTSEYAALYDFLKSHDGWSHYLPSTWLIATQKTPREMVEGIRERIRIPGDRFLVVRFDDYGGWMPQEQWDWIRTHRSTQMELGR